MSLFFRVYEHLLPKAAAWTLTIQKTLRDFFEGLSGGPADARAFVDDVYDDLSPETTTQISEWETQFGLQAGSTTVIRRLNLDAAWKSPGGQSPRYLQDVVQAAGFDLYIYDWWSSGPAPYVARDPRTYTHLPLFGTVQCGEPLAQCGEPDALCNAIWANEVHYLVNQNLTQAAPPPVPDDPDTWPYFMYWGGTPFGTIASISQSRRAELEELLLRLCPTQLWIVLLIDWIPASQNRITLAGDNRDTLAGDNLITLGT